MTQPAQMPTASKGKDKTYLWLRVEGAAVLVAALSVYALTGGNWTLFAVLLLAPDLFMLGYLNGPRLGATMYNLGHTYATPFALAAIGYFFALHALQPIAIIWIAHIGMDRMVGYGLKKPDNFKSTHLG